MQLISAPHAALVAADAVHEWLLWGGLAALFTALYIGIYIWMRRPSFGDRAPTDRAARTQDATSTPPPPPGDETDGGHDT